MIRNEAYAFCFNDEEIYIVFDYDMAMAYRDCFYAFPNNKYWDELKEEKTEDWNETDEFIYSHPTNIDVLPTDEFCYVEVGYGFRIDYIARKAETIIENWEKRNDKKWENRDDNISGLLKAVVITENNGIISDLSKITFYDLITYILNTIEKYENEYSYNLDNVFIEIGNRLDVEFNIHTTINDDKNIFYSYHLDYLIAKVETCFLQANPNYKYEAEETRDEIFKTYEEADEMIKKLSMEETLKILFSLCKENA